MASKSTYQHAFLSQPEFDALETHLTRIFGRRDVVEDIYPLTPLQEGMLFHTLAAESPDTYLVQQRIEIDGQIDVPSFQQAWSTAMLRHPALRSIFTWESNRPLQVVCDGLDVAIEFVDMTGEADRNRLVDDRSARDRRVGFRLDRPPLMRIALFRLELDRHIMMWTQHHILQDGWSASNILDEVFAIYEALSDGREPLLPDVRPFAAFVDWLEKRPSGESETFWKDHFAGFEQPTRLVDRQLESDSNGFTRRDRLVSLEFSAKMRDFAQERGLTVNALLAGAMALVVSRHVASNDVALALVASGRPPDFAGVESMVGMFINTVVVRIPIDAEMTAEEFLGQVQTRQAEVLEHQQTPLGTVQALSGLGSGTTLTDCMFALWNFGGSGATSDGTVAYRTVDAYGRTSFPISVTVEAADSIRVGIDFDRDDFAVERAEQMLDHYVRVLESILASPAAPVTSIAMLTDTELADRQAYNATDSAVPYDSVLEAFAAQASKVPARTAIVFGDVAMTYEELAHRSDLVARQVILQSGAQALRVAVHLPRSPDMVAATLGALKAGASYIPIDRHLPPHRVSQLLEVSGADLLITNDRLAALLPDHEVSTVTLEDIEGVELDLDIPIGPTDVAYVMYTSGSTGTPKGVMISHGALINYVWWAQAAYANGKPASFPLYTSTGFDLTITSLFVPLVSGGQIVIYPDTDARELSVLNVFEDDAVDVVKLTPSHLAVLEPHHFQTKRIRTLIIGGEDLRADLAKTVHDSADGNLLLYNEYGPTEATVGCMIHRYDPSSDPTGPVPIGGPISNSRIYLLDQNLSHVPTGTVGHLYVAGAGLADGYLHDLKLTGRSFVSDPFSPGERMYDTGDLAMWREPGVMEYVGRADDQMKVRGNRIEPGEIEAVLMEHPMVAKAAVAVRELNPGDRRLVAYYVPEPSVAANVSELRGFLSDRLPDYMVTRHLVRVDQLPLTTNGKLDRSRLPLALGEVTTSLVFAAPKTAAEHLVARLAADLLGVESVSIADNFFELGGHSILAMQLIGRIQKETDVRVSPRVILLNTLRHAAALLPEMTPEPQASVQREPAGRLETTVATNAAFFGPPSEPLFGIQTTPTGSATRHRAVLLCPPIGWEYMRTHWTIRRIARLLAADGFHVMRFDYFGTGDSSGDRAEGTIERWVADISTAAAEVTHASGVERVSVVGVRFGATLAALAAAQDPSIEHLVMWDPVVEGRAYLRTQQRLQAEMLETRKNRTVSPETTGDELLGFPFNAERRRQFDQIDLTKLAWPAVSTTVIASQPRLEYDSLVAAIGGAVDYSVVEDNTAWDDLSSSLTSLLPERAPQHIARTMGALHA